MKISIITATYNSSATLADTIESVLKQSHKDIEYIVIDGGSTDNTMEIVKSYEPRFNGNMKYISEKDNGLYDAMNKGISIATGDVIGILNSDDFYTSDDILENVAGKLTNPNVSAVYGDVHYVNTNNLSHCVRYYSSKIFRRGLMKLGFMPAHPSFYCKTEIYKKYGTFDTRYKVAADFEQLLRIIYVNKANVLYLPIDFVTMRTGGVSNSNLNSRVTIMKEHRIALKRNNVHYFTPFLYVRYFYKIYEILMSSCYYKNSIKRLQH